MAKSVIKPRFVDNEFVPVEIENKQHFVSLNEFKNNVLSDVPVQPPFDPETGIIPNTLHGNRIITNTLDGTKVTTNTLDASKIKDATIDQSKVKFGTKFAKFSQVTISSSLQNKVLLNNAQMQGSNNYTLKVSDLLCSIKRSFFFLGSSNPTATSGTNIKVCLYALVGGNTYIEVAYTPNLHDGIFGPEAELPLFINTESFNSGVYIALTLPLYIGFSTNNSGVINGSTYLYMTHQD